MISVNGQQIGEPEILAEMQYHPAPSRDAAYAEAAEALVVRELLLQRAAAAGLAWAATPEGEEGAIEALLARELKLPEADPTAVRRYFDNNGAKFRSPDLFEASHILYLAPREDAEAQARARTSAERTLAILKADPAVFGKIAKAESACASAGEGGRLGQVAAGDTAPEIDTFLQALEDGQLCPVPVETRYGVHVLRLDRRIPGRAFAFEEVQDQIARDLAANAWRRAVSGYIALLAASARVNGIEIRTAVTPLVQ
ncbi:MAG: peptidylprolyl isomerase [Alphaproteobacteria bacterium]|nr:peptidylprolyl isomerase [Alphaproteobacteria bacterium]